MKKLLDKLRLEWDVLRGWVTVKEHGDDLLFQELVEIRRFGWLRTPQRRVLDANGKPVQRLIRRRVVVSDTVEWASGPEAFEES